MLLNMAKYNAENMKCFTNNAYKTWSVWLVFVIIPLTLRTLDIG